MPDSIFIQHRFTITKDGKTLSDALILPKEEYEALSQAQLTALKTARFDAWKHHIDNPPVQKELTSDELIADITQELTQLDEQKQLLLTQKTQLEESKSILVKGVK